MTAEEKETYTRIIDGILATADLQTVTRKKIRQGLEEAIDKDLSEQKVCLTWSLPPPFQRYLLLTSRSQIEIKNLIEDRFDAISNAVSQAIPTPTSGTPADPETNGHTPGSDDAAEDEQEDDEIQVSLPPVSKKQKRESSASEDADARLAAELQAQENRLSRGRVTRGAGAAKPKATAKAKAGAGKNKKKSAKRVRDEDDSNVDDSDAEEKPKRKAGGGFQKPFNLSYPLAELCGESQVCFLFTPMAWADAD